jgi:hypothetical protein
MVRTIRRLNTRISTDEYLVDQPSEEKMRAARSRMSGNKHLQGKRKKSMTQPVLIYDKPDAEDQPNM